MPDASDRVIRRDPSPATRFSPLGELPHRPSSTVHVTDDSVSSDEAAQLDNKRKAERSPVELQVLSEFCFNVESDDYNIIRNCVHSTLFKLSTPAQTKLRAMCESMRAETNAEKDRLTRESLAFQNVPSLPLFGQTSEQYLAALTLRNELYCQEQAVFIHAQQILEEANVSDKTVVQWTGHYECEEVKKALNQARPPRNIPLRAERFCDSQVPTRSS